jgi:hypothetical protein
MQGRLLKHFGALTLMKLLQELLSESFAWLFKPLQSHQSLDVFKLAHGILWVLVAHLVNVSVLFHKIFKVGLEQSMCVKQSRSDGPFRDSKYLADFGMLVTLNIVKSHHRAVVFGQLHHGRVQPFLQLMDVHLA